MKDNRNAWEGVFLEHLSNLKLNGVVLERRQDDSETMTNVPLFTVHHSPTGFEWGYNGSGPADLALNICIWYLETNGYDGPTSPSMEGVHVPSPVWSFYQQFKSDMISRIPTKGGTISYDEIAEWMETHGVYV